MRLRTNFITGTVSEAPLTNVATSLTLGGALAALPTINSPDIAVLIIDPNDEDALAGSAPEIIYVTSHTAGGGSGTILRGREGTTAVPHSNGTKIVHAATAADWSDVAQLDAPSNTLQGNLVVGGSAHVTGDAQFGATVEIVGVLATTARITAAGGILVQTFFTQIPSSDGGVFAINNAANSATMTSFDTTQPSWGVFVQAPKSTEFAQFTSVRNNASNQTQGFGLHGGIAYDYNISRVAGSDHIDFVTWDGANERIRIRHGTDGQLRAEGVDHYFGSGAMGQTNFGAMLHINAPASAFVTLEAQSPNFDHAHMVILPSGSGDIYLGDGEGQTMMALRRLSALAAGQTAIASLGYKDAVGSIQNAFVRAETAPNPGAHYLVVYPGA